MMGKLIYLAGVGEGGTKRKLVIGSGIPCSTSRLIGNSVHPTRVSSTLLHAKVLHELIHTIQLIGVLKTKTTFIEKFGEKHFFLYKLPCFKKQKEGARFYYAVYHVRNLSKKNVIFVCP